jgi:hypothetical protein
MKGEEHFVEVLRRKVRQQRIIVHAHVGDKGGMVVGAQGKAKGLPSGRDGSGDPAGGEVDPDQTEIAAVQYQQLICIGVIEEIGGEAVLIV